MKTAILAATGLILGCGGMAGPESTRAEKLIIGAWVASSTTLPCFDIYDFAEGSQFDRGVACVLQDGSYGMEKQGGTYAIVDDKQIQYAISAATCPPAEVTERSGAIGFSVTDAVLTLMYSNAVETFQRQGDPTGSGIIKFGCFHGDIGKFTASTFAPL